MSGPVSGALSLFFSEPIVRSVAIEGVKMVIERLMSRSERHNVPVERVEVELSSEHKTLRYEGRDAIKALGVFLQHVKEDHVSGGDN